MVEVYRWNVSECGRFPAVMRTPITVRLCRVLELSSESNQLCLCFDVLLRLTYHSFVIFYSLFTLFSYWNGWLHSGGCFVCRLRVKILWKVRGCITDSTCCLHTLKNAVVIPPIHLFDSFSDTRCDSFPLPQVVMQVSSNDISCIVRLKRLLSQLSQLVDIVELPS